MDFQDGTGRAWWPEGCYPALEMRIFFKLLMKLLMMAAIVLLSAGGLKYGTRMMTGSSGGMLGAAGAQTTSEESDLMSTVMQSALRLVSGKATRSELANELSEKLYSQRGDASDMSELGIDLVKAKSPSPAPGADAPHADPKADAKSTKNPGAPALGPRTGAPVATTGAGVAAELPSGPELISGKSQSALAELWQRMKPYTVELSLVPVVFLGMVLVSRVRRRKREASFVPEFAAVLPESDCDTHDMKHPAHSLQAEEFELVVAMIYQRQGYRVSLPAGLGGGRGGDFRLSRKSERLLVKCENMNADHRVPVEQVRELHDAMTDASATGAFYVASCGFTWDARHFAKTRQIKLINAKTLDALLEAARATPDEDLLAVTPWVSKFMTKVEVTTARCPECEAEMEQVNEGNGSVWLCSQRPECPGRRVERKYQKTLRTPAQDAGIKPNTADAPKPAPESVTPTRREPSQQPRSQHPVPHTAREQQAIEAVGSIPPAAPRRQGAQLPVAKPVAAKPAPSPARDVGSIPPAAPSRPSTHLPATQPATSKPVPGPGTRRNAGVGGIRGTAPKRRGFVIVENRPAAAKPAPVLARASGGIPAAAPSGRSTHLPVTQSATPKPAASPPPGESTARNADAGSAPPPAPRRRGFRLPENERATPKPTSKPA